MGNFASQVSCFPRKLYRFEHKTVAMEIHLPLRYRVVSTFTAEPKIINFSETPFQKDGRTNVIIHESKIFFYVLQGIMGTPWTFWKQEALLDRISGHLSSQMHFRDCRNFTVQWETGQIVVVNECWRQFRDVQYYVNPSIQSTFFHNEPFVRSAPSSPSLARTFFIWYHSLLKSFLRKDEWIGILYFSCHLYLQIAPCNKFQIEHWFTFYLIAYQGVRWQHLVAKKRQITSQISTFTLSVVAAVTVVISISLWPPNRISCNFFQLYHRSSCNIFFIYTRRGLKSRAETIICDPLLLPVSDMGKIIYHRGPFGFFPLQVFVFHPGDWYVYYKSVQDCKCLPLETWMWSRILSPVFGHLCLFAKGPTLKWNLTLSRLSVFSIFSLAPKSWPSEKFWSGPSDDLTP